MELNNITNTGTWGQQVTRLNDNFNKVALGIDTLQEMYESLSQSAIEVVDTLPQTGEANKIYRLVGTTSYSDYMYNADDLNTPILMATYNNGIDDAPTAESNNLVKSGGVYNNLGYNTKHIVIANAPNLHTDDFISVKQGTKCFIRLNTLSPDSIDYLSVYVAYQNNLSDLTNVGVIDRYIQYIEFNAPIDFRYIQMRRAGITFSIDYTAAIKGVEQDMEKVDIKAEKIPAIEEKQDFYEGNTFGYIPKLYQGAVNTSGVWNSANQARCTTKVFRNPDTDGIILTAKAGYEVVLAHGDSENSLTELGYVISGTNGGTYKYTGGKPYLYLNIAKNPSVYFSPKDVLNGDILIESAISLNQHIQNVESQKYNDSPKGFEMTVYGNSDGIRKLYTSSFVFRKGRKYKIEYESTNFATNVANGGVVLRLQNEDASFGIYSLTSTSAGTKPLPNTQTFVPTSDGTLYVYANLSDGSWLNIKVTQIEQDVLQLIKDSSRIVEELQTIKEVSLENQLLGGAMVGDEKTTTVFPIGVVFVKKDGQYTGECYISQFQSLTKISEYDGKPADFSGVIVGFNMANPEKTAQTYIALAPDTVVFEGQEYLAGYCEDCVLAQIDDNTIRVLMSTAIETYSVYRDFNLTTKQFEQYCHQAYITIEGTDYRLMGNNAQAIISALGLTSHATTQNSVYRRSAAIKIGDYYYVVMGFDDVTTICRTKNFGTDFEFITQIPTGTENVDEVSICYQNNRIYAHWTGNKTRRPNGDYSKVVYLDVTWDVDSENLPIIVGGTWGTPVELTLCGHDAPAIVSIEGNIYVMAQCLKWQDYSQGTVQRADTYLNGRSVGRSIKSVFVFDTDLNLLNKVDLRLRRGINTPRFCNFEDNLYFYCGTNPKALIGADSRQNLIFSYVDKRIIDM